MNDGLVDTQQMGCRCAQSAANRPKNTQLSSKTRRIFRIALLGSVLRTSLTQLAGFDC